MEGACHKTEKQKLPYHRAFKRKGSGGSGASIYPYPGAGRQRALYQALDHVSDYQWAVFTSPTGAEIFFDELKHRRMDIRSLAGIRIAAIGEGTRKILEDRGLLTDLMPEIYDGDCLGETLAKRTEGRRAES